MNFSAVILAGGKSSRMGCDKAFLEIAGQPLLARQIETVRAAGAEEIFISGRADRDYSAFGLPVLRDPCADAGPLAGIHAALAVSRNPLLLVLAVDLAEMNAMFLCRLLMASVAGEGIIPRISGQVEPLAAIYPLAAAPLAWELISQGKFAVRDFADACVCAGLAAYHEVAVDFVSLFRNLNSPADL